MSITSKLYDYDACSTRIKLGKKIGQGAFGSVYEGQYWPNPNDRETFQDVAIKVMKIEPRNSMSQPNKVALNLVDGLISAFLASKGCPVSKTIKSILCSENARIQGMNKDFLVIMDMIHGMELKQYASENLPLEIKTSLTKQILEGYVCLHSNLVFHRDIKTENMMVDLTDKHDPRIKIIDFGLSCVDKSDEFDKFMKDNLNIEMYAQVKPYICRRPNGDHIGAALYTPPETNNLGSGAELILLPDVPKTKELRDSFALGCALYEIWQTKGDDVAVDFKVPVRDANDLREYYKKTLRGELPALRIYDKNVPEYIKDITFKLMEYDHAKRITVKEALELFNTEKDDSKESAIAASSSGFGTPLDNRQDINVLVIGEEKEHPSTLIRYATDAMVTVGDNSDIYKIDKESCLCVFEVFEKKFSEWKDIIQDNLGLVSVIFLIIDSQHEKETLEVIKMLKILHKSNTPIYLVDRVRNNYVDTIARQDKIRYIVIPKNHHKDDHKIIEQINNSFNVNL